MPTAGPIGSVINIEISGSVLSSTSICGLVENERTGLITTCSITPPAISCTTTK